jgi:hypothetical protein
MKKINRKISEKEMRRASSILETQSKGLIIILRVHLLIEGYLDKFLLSFFKKGNIIVQKMSFYQKITIIEATEKIDSNLLCAIRKLNEIRNKFAHNLNYNMTKTEINTLHKYCFNVKSDCPVDLYTLLLCLVAIAHSHIIYDVKK